MCTMYILKDISHTENRLMFRMLLLCVSIFTKTTNVPMIFLNPYVNSKIVVVKEFLFDSLFSPSQRK